MNEKLLEYLRGHYDERKAPLFAGLRGGTGMIDEFYRSLALVVQIAVGVMLGLYMYSNVLGHSLSVVVP